MHIYHRQALEDKIVAMAHAKDLGAKDLLEQVFHTVPGTLIGVVVCNPATRSVVFLARATHPNEPISFFQNLDGSQSQIINTAAANLPFSYEDCYVTPDEFYQMASSLSIPSDERLAKGIANAIVTTMPQVKRVLVIPEYGFLALTPDRIEAKLQNPHISREVYKLWKPQKKI